MFTGSGLGAEWWQEILKTGAERGFEYIMPRREPTPMPVIAPAPAVAPAPAPLGIPMLPLLIGGGLLLLLLMRK